MSNVIELSGNAIKEGTIPTVGKNKIWYRGAEPGPAPTYSDVRIGTFITSITDGSITQTENKSTGINNAYNAQFSSLISEAQQSSVITDLLTTDVTYEIYTKISNLMYNAYNMASVIHESFANTSFPANQLYDNPIALTNSITSTYKENFSKNEIINVFELETPTSIRTPYYINSSAQDAGIKDKKVLFSSADLYIVEDTTQKVLDRQLGGKTLNTLAVPNTTQSNYIVNGKRWAEYARDYGIETAIHSNVLSSPDIKDIRRDNKHTSSGFMITRDGFETITGLIFYYTLIVPRPYLKDERTMVTNALYGKLATDLQTIANETRHYNSLKEYYGYQIAVYNQISGIINETDTINRSVALLSSYINADSYQNISMLYKKDGTDDKKFKAQLLIDLDSYLNQSTSKWITAANLTSMTTKFNDNTTSYNTSKANLDTKGKNNIFLDMYNRYKLDLDAYNISETNYNTNNRESYIAVSSSINIFDLSEYYSIRKNIVSSNLVTLLIYTNKVINNTIGFNFKNGDTEFEFGHKSEFENLKCIVSNIYTSWSGKKISDCKLPYTNIDYPNHIYDIISSINNVVSRNSMIDNQKLMFTKQLGNDKLIIIINIRIAKSSGKISFQMKDIQYNNLFPGPIIIDNVLMAGLS